MTDFLFPHETPREQQTVLMDAISKCIEDNKHIMIQAPTGLGKTAAALAPALTYALKHKKKVFFLTSRYTQHVLALHTVKAINERHDKHIVCADIIAKKNMCLFPQAEGYSSSEFTSFCKKLRENHQCKYFTGARKSNGLLTPDATLTVENLTRSFADATVIKDVSEASQLCPYEMAAEVARKADVVVGDYFYMFHPKIRDSFLKRIGCSIEDTIIIVDEAHNLPGRIKELASAKLTSFVTDNAIKEALVHDTPDANKVLVHIHSLLNRFNDISAPEQVVPKQWFIDAVKEEIEFTEAIELLDEAQAIVLDQKQRSFIASVHEFLVKWQTDLKGFVRIISKDEKGVTLALRCLDPRMMTADIAEAAQSVIMMSGTLEPLNLYSDTLGFRDAEKIRFDNPFPKENAQHLIVPQTTTRYAERTDQQYKDIAKICAEMVNKVPGNCAIFLPSYYFQKQVERYFTDQCDKTVFVEHASFQKQERTALLETFKQYKKSGAVLLGVANGSFGEGVDLPGDLLKCVVVVGLPLSKPDLETNQLIKYYDEQFGNGWDYGYIYPAFNTLLQNAGRCIRSSTDKGVVVYLDKRFGWPKYLRYFPKDTNLKVSAKPVDDIAKFFL